MRGKESTKRREAWSRVTSSKLIWLIFFSSFNLITLSAVDVFGAGEDGIN